MFKSIQEARQFIQENGIQMVDFKLTDLDGAGGILPFRLSG